MSKQEKMKTDGNLITRNEADFQLSTFREADNSVEFVLATENPAIIKDSTYGKCRESLMSDGVSLPPNNQVPLLDCHDRGGITNILGSVREIRQEGDKVIGRAYFANTPRAKEALELIKGGHLKSGSVGYTQGQSEWIADGQIHNYNNRAFSGPMLLTTKWNLSEFSLVPVPADEYATVRQAPDNGVPNCKERAVAEDKNIEKKEVSQMEPKETNVNVEEVTRAAADNAVKAERERMAAISELCTKNNCADIQTRAFKENLTVEQTQGLVIEELQKRSQALSSASKNVTITADESDKFRSAAVDGLLMRSGMDIEKPADGALDMQRYGLKGIAREIVRRSGKNGMFSDDEALGLVFRAGSQAYADFTNILDTAMNKAVMKGYRQAPDTWRRFCTKGNLPNLEPAKRVDLNDMPDFIENPEGAEIQDVILGDKGETIKLVTYAAKIKLTRRAILADDLGLFNKIARKIGYRAAQKIEAMAYDVLTANAAMSDGHNLFDSTYHHNIGTAGALSKSTLAAAYALMQKQTDVNGTVIDVTPKYLLVSPDEAVEAEILTASTIDPSTTNTMGATNFFRNRNLVAISTPRINMSSNGFYLVADPASCDTIEVAFLNGNENPTIETIDNDKDILGRSWRTYIDIGAKAMDFRGMVKVAHS